MTNPLTRAALPDSELAARWAADALTEGRVELGYALARLAAQAYRVEAERASHAAHAAIPGPATSLYIVPSEPMSAARYADATDEAKLHKLVAGQLADGGPGKWLTPSEDAAQAPVTRRCEAKVTRDGIADVCHGVAQFDPERAMWRHLHNEWDAHHVPVVPPTEVQ